MSLSLTGAASKAMAMLQQQAHHHHRQPPCLSTQACWTRCHCQEPLHSQASAAPLPCQHDTHQRQHQHWQPQQRLLLLLIAPRQGTAELELRHLRRLLHSHGVLQLRPQAVAPLVCL